MKKHFLILVFIGFSLIGFGQFRFESVFRGLSGDELKAKVVEKYKPKKVLDYSEARDVLYGKIYNENDTVYGVYTRYGLYLPPGVDPSNYLYKNGMPSGINAEHTYPRSKGAKDGNPKSDMHHLFPAKINVNSDRGSLPFNEINDNQTKDWYYNNIILHKIPQQHIDEYSEHINTYFEPREDHKGNVARAMMYFYTMYKAEADNEDPNYFKKQVKTLCDWHFQDPVDSLEWFRTWEIAKYQDDKPNPFVLDCSLASRTYCDDYISDECQAVGVDDIYDAKSLNMFLYPNPVVESLKIRFNNPGIHRIAVSIFNLLGELRLSRLETISDKNINELEINTSMLKQGIYLIQLNGIYKNKPIIANKLFVVK